MSIDYEDFDPLPKMPDGTTVPQVLQAVKLMMEGNKAAYQKAQAEAQNPKAQEPESDGPKTIEPDHGAGEDKIPESKPEATGTEVNTAPVK